MVQLGDVEKQHDQQDIQNVSQKDNEEILGNSSQPIQHPEACSVAEIASADVENATTLSAGESSSTEKSSNELPSSSGQPDTEESHSTIRPQFTPESLEIGDNEQTNVRVFESTAKLQFNPQTKEVFVKGNISDGTTSAETNLLLSRQIPVPPTIGGENVCYNITHNQYNITQESGSVVCGTEGDVIIHQVQSQ